MTSNLATKNDVLLLRQGLKRFEQQMTARFESLEGRFSSMGQSFESRLVFKLGALMVVLFGLAVAVFELLG